MRDSIRIKIRELCSSGVSDMRCVEYLDSGYDLSDQELGARDVADRFDQHSVPFCRRTSTTGHTREGAFSDTALMSSVTKPKPETMLVMRKQKFVISSRVMIHDCRRSEPLLKYLHISSPLPTSLDAGTPKRYSCQSSAEYCQEGPKCCSAAKYSRFERVVGAGACSTTA